MKRPYPITEITISGTTGVGKSLYADGLVRAAENAGMKVAISDHELFTQHQKFDDHVSSIRQGHRDAGVVLSVLVVNDGKRSLRVDFGGNVPYHLACLIFPGMGSSSP